MDIVARRCMDSTNTSVVVRRREVSPFLALLFAIFNIPRIFGRRTTGLLPLVLLNFSNLGVVVAHSRFSVASGLSGASDHSLVPSTPSAQTVALPSIYALQQSTISGFVCVCVFSYFYSVSPSS